MKVVVSVAVLMGVRLMAVEFDPLKSGGATELPKQAGVAASNPFDQFDDPAELLKRQADAEQNAAAAAANGVEALTALSLRGNSAATLRLARMYVRGDGVVEDSAEAVKWYRKAAEQGNAVAQSNLGVMR